VSFIGHGDPEIAKAMATQLQRLEFAHTSQFSNDPSEKLARELLEFAGPAFTGGAVYLASGGSEAVETALKLARHYQVELGQSDRFEIISRRQSYHGATLGAVAVSGNLRRRTEYLPMVREFRQINTPYCYRCHYDACAVAARSLADDVCTACAAEYASELEHAIAESQGKAAAFICEPVSGATLGAAVPPEGYLQQIRKICDDHGLLWIADEVMSGCGRTGRNFACEHWRVAPDIIAAGKGLSSGYAPLGAVIASSKVVEAIASGSGLFTHGFTYNAHPVSAAAGSAVLQRIGDLHLAKAADHRVSGTVAAHFAKAVKSLNSCKSVGDVRGIGLLWGVEFVSDKESTKPFDPGIGFAGQVFEAARNRGVLVYPMQGCADGYAGDHLLLAPPAIVTGEEIEQGISALRAAIEEVECRA